LIVLDTHAWVWWAAEPERLSSKARSAIEEADALGVSPISCWEVAMLVTHRRLEFDRDTLVWIRQALALPRLALLPVTPEVAVAAAHFPPEFPGDPADRLIAAAALAERAPLVTKDRHLRSSPILSTIW